MINKLSALYNRILLALVYTLLVVAGVGVMTMMLVTCADVVFRRFGYPVIGAFDIVKISSAITLAAALPYTTAVKGHVAIEYFFHKFNRVSRIVVDTVVRLLGMMLFAFLGWQSFSYGAKLFESGQVTQTLQLPVFWVAYFIGFCNFVVLLVILYNLLHPGREMIKP